MKSFFSILLCFFSLATFAQVPQPAMLWLKVLGGNGSDILLPPVTKTSDGGFIISYQTTSTSGPIDSICGISNPEIVFQKYNSDATNLEWTKCYEANNDTFLLYIFEQTDGSTIFGGEYNSDAGWGFYICKQNSFGNITWSHGFSKGNNALLDDMINTNDGGYIMIGEVYYIDTNFTIHYGNYNTDIGVLKLDSLGNKVWCKVIGGTDEDKPAKVLNAPNNGFYIFGVTLSNNFDCTGNHGGADAYLSRLDNLGNIIWHRDLGGSNDDGGGWLDNGYACEDGKGGIIMTCASASSDGDISNHINLNGENIWVINVDSNGNIAWNNCYGGGGQEYPNAICKATDGSIWIAGVSTVQGGEVDTIFGQEDAWFVHADSIGNFLSAKVIGSKKMDIGLMVYPLSNGNVIGGGFYDTSSGTFQNIFYGGDDAFIAVFTPWTTEINNINVTKNKINIYPNPCNKKLIIEPLNYENYEITICDTMLLPETPVLSIVSED